MNSIDVAQVMYDQGFRGSSGVNGLAVVGAETAGSFDEMIVHVNVGGTKPGSRDRGLWAINDQWHPEVTDECAFDPVCSTAEAWRLSKQGTSYGAWATFTNNSYERYLPIARVAWEAAKRHRADAAFAASLAEDVKDLEGQVSDLLRQLADTQRIATEQTTRADQAAALNIQLSADLEPLKAEVARFDAWVDSIRRGP